jgi:hypothetical protein
MYLKKLMFICRKSGCMPVSEDIALIMPHGRDAE